MTQLRAITNLATNSTKTNVPKRTKNLPLKASCAIGIVPYVKRHNNIRINIVFENSRYSIAGNIGEGTLRQSEMLKVSVLCSIDGVLEILGICQYLPFSPYNHKNNLLINSETLHTKSQQRLSKVLILLRWKMIGVNDVSLVNCYFTASLKVKTFLGSGSFGEVKKIYVFHGIPLVEKEIDFELKNWRLHPCSRATPPRKLFVPDFPPLIFFIPRIAIELMWAIGKVNACSLDHWIVPKQFLCRNLVALLLAGGSNFVYLKHLHL